MFLPRYSFGRKAWPGPATYADLAIMPKRSAWPFALRSEPRADWPVHPFYRPPLAPVRLASISFRSSRQIWMRSSHGCAIPSRVRRPSHEAAGYFGHLRAVTVLARWPRKRGSVPHGPVFRLPPGRPAGQSSFLPCALPKLDSFLLFLEQFSGT